MRNDQIVLIGVAVILVLIVATLVWHEIELARLRRDHGAHTDDLAGVRSSVDGVRSGIRPDDTSWMTGLGELAVEVNRLGSEVTRISAALRPAESGETVQIDDRETEFAEIKREVARLGAFLRPQHVKAQAEADLIEEWKAARDAAPMGSPKRNAYVNRLRELGAL